MTGTIFGIFKVEEVDGEMQMVDNYINNNFMWLFEFFNAMESIACILLEKPHYFIIKLDKNETDKSKKT